MAKVYNAETGEQKTVLPANGKEFTLKELQGYVGGNIELVHPIEGNIVYGDIWAHEEELLKSSCHMNEVISDMVGHSIVGDVIITQLGETS